MEPCLQELQQETAFQHQLEIPGANYKVISVTQQFLIHFWASMETWQRALVWPTILPCLQPGTSVSSRFTVTRQDILVPFLLSLQSMYAFMMEILCLDQRISFSV